MKEMIRIYGDISPEHERVFKFIKGAFGSKNNGEVFERMIEVTLPTIDGNVTVKKFERDLKTKR